MTNGFAICNQQDDKGELPDDMQGLQPQKGREMTRERERFSKWGNIVTVHGLEIGVVVGILVAQVRQLGSI